MPNTVEADSGLSKTWDKCRKNKKYISINQKSNWNFNAVMSVV